MKKVLLWCIAIAMLGLAVVTIVRFPDIFVHLPVFPSTEESTPQAIWHLRQDYAVRVGDLVKTDLFIRQNQGSLIFVNSPTVEGDFELVSSPHVSAHTNSDGSTTYRLAYVLRSFSVKPKLSLEMTFPWQHTNTSELRQLTVPKLEIFTSNTWDGRHTPKEGEDPRVPLYLIWLRFAFPMTVALVLFAALTIGLPRCIVERRITTPESARLRDFQELLATLKQDKADGATFYRMDTLVREQFKLQSVPLALLPANNPKLPVTRFLQLVAPLLYSGRDSEQADINQLIRCGEAIGSAWMTTLSKSRPSSKTNDAH